MQNYTFIPYRLLQDTLSPETLPTATLNEGNVPSHLALRLNTYMTGTSKTTKDNFPWLNKKDKTKHY